MLRRYLASEAYMYCGETLYNIPWMLLYFSGKYISLWHVRVRKESWLHEFLRERKDLSLFPVISKEGKEILYLCVEKTGKWMDLRLDFVEQTTNQERPRQNTGRSERKAGNRSQIINKRQKRQAGWTRWKSISER